MTAYLLDRAWVDGAVRDDVLVEVADGRFASVTPDTREARGATRIGGLTLPGFANTHSHAFHRALRGRTQAGRGSFWTWREQMYAVARALDPDSYRRLAIAVYKEMIATGITCVGEFHYLHHDPTGRPYDDPNALSRALIEAAAEAGIRLTLLDTAYLSSGFGEPPAGVQVRFSDGTADAWAERVSALDAEDLGDVVLGAAIHSVRAVPADQLETVALWTQRAGGQRPLHAHLSEQVAENEACLARHGCTPTALLEAHGALTPATSAVHATHLTDGDIAALAAARSIVSLCPTTERDLGDGIGPARTLHEAGVAITLGSDSHAVIDHFEEMRATELDERLATQERGHWPAGELVDAATVTGHASLGWADAGRIAVGDRADLVTVDVASPRTAGTGADEHTAVFAAGAADVTSVMVDGRFRVAPGGARDHAAALGAELNDVIGGLWT